MGLWRVARSAPRRQSGSWVNTGLFVLMISLVGARLFYVWVNWGYFADHLIETLMVWLGGLSWPGALIGGWLALTGLALSTRGSHTRISLGWIGDRLYPILPPLAITTWLGAWQSGIAYGALISPGKWWSVPSLDESGIYYLHWPLQPLAAFSLLLYFAILEMRVKPLRPVGRLSALALFGLLVNLLAASLMRVDPAPIWYGLRVDTVFAAAFLLLFLAYLLFNRLAMRIWKREATTFVP